MTNKYQRLNARILEFINANGRATTRDIQNALNIGASPHNVMSGYEVAGRCGVLYRSNKIDKEDRGPDTPYIIWTSRSDAEQDTAEETPIHQVYDGLDSISPPITLLCTATFFAADISAGDIIARLASVGLHAQNISTETFPRHDEREGI